jgi:hypothetical protein
MINNVYDFMKQYKDFRERLIKIVDEEELKQDKPLDILSSPNVRLIIDFDFVDKDPSTGLFYICYVYTRDIGRYHMITVDIERLLN